MSLICKVKYMQNNGCWQGNHTGEFSALLGQLETPRKEIAFALGLPYHTLEKYYLGFISFPPDLIPPLYSLTKDRRLIEFFTTPCGFYLRRKPFSAKETNDPVREAYDLSIAVGTAQKIVRDALSDGRLSVQEHGAIHKALDVLEKEIEHVHSAIDAKKVNSEIK
jgi:hypothetical protein